MSLTGLSSLHCSEVCLLFDDAQGVSVAVGAVFDGHGGKEASKMASEKFLDYFFLHVVFNTYKKLLLHKKDNEEIDIRSFTHKRFEPKLDSDHSLIAIHLHY